MDSFLPQGYRVPSTGAGSSKERYTNKFVVGANRFRFLSNPAMGWEGWIDTEDGSTRPVRVREIDRAKLPINARDIKHYWWVVVWDYQVENVQILSISQKGIKESIIMLNESTHWGSPKGYDISIMRVGDKTENTRYQVLADPHSTLPADILKKIEDAGPVDLNALFSNEDPFATEPKVTEPAQGTPIVGEEYEAPGSDISFTDEEAAANLFN